MSQPYAAAAIAPLKEAAAWAAMIWLGSPSVPCLSTVQRFQHRNHPRERGNAALEEQELFARERWALILVTLPLGREKPSP
ncbi:MAG: hypothetical protein ACKVVP_10370 [Chloroflexota bacterium]